MLDLCNLVLVLDLCSLVLVLNLCSLVLVLDLCSLVLVLDLCSLVLVLDFSNLVHVLDLCSLVCGRQAFREEREKGPSLTAFLRVQTYFFLLWIEGWVGWGRGGGWRADETKVALAQ